MVLLNAKFYIREEKGLYFKVEESISNGTAKIKLAILAFLYSRVCEKTFKNREKPAQLTSMHTNEM